MREILIALSMAGVVTTCFAQGTPSVQEITQKIVHSATNYGNSISCPGVVVEPKLIAALVPYKTIDDRMDARYAALWVGDVGCAGGSGTTHTNIAIVSVGAGDSFVVDPSQSSPIIQFESPVRNVERVVGNTRDSIILEGKAYGDKDSNCCPSIPIRFTMKPDENGNWKMTEKKILKR